MRKRWLISVAMCLCVVSVLSWGAFQYFSIQKIGDETLPEHADVIIVLGAGVWQNGASPAMQGRVRQALDIYRQRSLYEQGIEDEIYD